MNGPKDSAPGQHRQEQLATRIELATAEDWEAYKKMRIDEISGADGAMFASTPEMIATETARTPDEWRSDLTGGNFVVLAWHDTEPVGMAFARKEPEEGTYYMRADYVAPNFRGQGLQRKMIAQRMLEVIKRGGKKITLTMHNTNSNSLKNYQSFGFKVTGSRKFNREDYPFLELDDLNSPELINKINEVLAK